MTNDSKTPIADGVILGAQVIAAGAALYMLFNGKEAAPKVKEWAVKMEEEIVEKVDSVKDITEPALAKIMDSVQAKYEKIKDIDKDELVDAIQTLHTHWKSVIAAK